MDREAIFKIKEFVSNNNIDVDIESHKKPCDNVYSILGFQNQIQESGFRDKSKDSVFSHNKNSSRFPHDLGFLDTMLNKMYFVTDNQKCTYLSYNHQME